MLEALPDLLGRNHPLTARAKSVQARCWSKLGRVSDAKSMRMSAIEINTSVLGSQHLTTLRARCNYAKILQDAGEYEDAEQMMAEVLDDQTRYLPADHPHTTASNSSLVEICERRAKPYAYMPRRAVEGDGDEKFLHLERLRKSYKEGSQVLRENDLEMLILLREVALAHKVVGDPDQALTILLEVSARQSEVLTPIHPDSLTTMLELGRLTQITNAQKLQLKEGVLAMIRDR